MTFPSATQFAFVLGKIGRSVTRTPTTKTTDNITGRETLTSGTDVTITAIAMRVDRTWTQADVLKLEGADGYIMTPATVTLNEHDLITFDDETFEVVELITMKPHGTNVFKYGKLMVKS